MNQRDNGEWNVLVDVEDVDERDSNSKPYFYVSALNNSANLIDMKEHFHQWFSKERVKDQIDDQILEMVSWLFTLYYEVLCLLRRKNIQVDDQFVLHCFNKYVDDVFTEKWNLNDVKNDIMTTIDDSDKYLFDIPTPNVNQCKYRKELKALVETINIEPSRFSKEDFDIRISLNLSSAHDHYRTKKIVIEYIIKNTKDSFIIKKQQFWANPYLGDFCVVSA